MWKIKETSDGRRSEEFWSLYANYAENIAKIHRKLGFDRKFQNFKTNICDKLTTFPLFEYKDKNIIEEMRNCKINAENGRIL